MLEQLPPTLTISRPVRVVIDLALKRDRLLSLDDMRANMSHESFAFMVDRPSRCTQRCLLAVDEKLLVEGLIICRKIVPLKSKDGRPYSAAMGIEDRKITRVQCHCQPEDT